MSYLSCFSPSGHMHTFHTVLAAIASPAPALSFLRCKRATGYETLQSKNNSAKQQHTFSMTVSTYEGFFPPPKNPMLKSMQRQESEMPPHLPAAAGEARCEGSGAVPSTRAPKTSAFPFAFPFCITISSAKVQRSLTDFENIILLLLKSCF